MIKLKFWLNVFKVLIQIATWVNLLFFYFRDYSRWADFFHNSSLIRIIGFVNLTKVLPACAEQPAYSRRRFSPSSPPIRRSSVGAPGRSRRRRRTRASCSRRDFRWRHSRRPEVGLVHCSSRCSLCTSSGRPLGRPDHCWRRRKPPVPRSSASNGWCRPMSIETDLCLIVVFIVTFV